MPELPLKMEHVVKCYSGRSVLRSLSLCVEQGDFLAVMGPSGSGKSTLLHAAAGLISVDAGKIAVDGVFLNTLGDSALSELRRKKIGLVFQSFTLIPNLTVGENIMLPLLAGSFKPDMARYRNLAERLGIADKLERFPLSLSGGEQQRAAIARALLPEPALILADEPTGSLDSAAGSELCGLLRELCREKAHTVVMVTHEPSVALAAKHVLVLKDGAFAGEIADTAGLAVDALYAEYHRILEIAE